MIFIRWPFLCDLRVLDCEKNSICADVIKNNIESHLGYDGFSLFYNGKPLQKNDVVPDDSTVEVVLSLPGGKGGFGSMLRAIGAQIEKTTNREACRDLSGRRLRDINEEQRLKKWIAKEAEREAEKVRRRQARIERLKTKAPHKFFDFEYEREISELPDRINDALSEGLQKAKKPSKRPAEETEIPKKKLWLDDEFSGSSSGSESDEAQSSSASGSQSKKVKLTRKETPSCESDASESSSSLQYPCSSKDSCFSMEESSESSDRKVVPSERDYDESSTSSKSVSQDAQQYEDSKEKQNDGKDISSPTQESTVAEPGSSNMENVAAEFKKTEEKVENVDKNMTESNVAKATKEVESEEDSPIDLLDFQSASELETLGLDRLKSALMARGLKCGGTLSDRAQRLWKIRGLQPHQYPANLLAKTKK